MSCGCKHNIEEIKREQDFLDTFRKLFINRLTIDKSLEDRRKKNFNQALFDKDECWACWSEIDLDMIMEEFELAVQDALYLHCDDFDINNSFNHKCNLNKYKSSHI